VQAVASRALSVTDVEAKPANRNPAPPFMTSTLQQEASRKYGMGARQTMNAAQRLYEAGHITYMRTDGIDMAPEAVHAARDTIKTRYGAEYVPADPRMYKNKAKNAQEAHECIRPTDLSKSPDDIRLSEDDQRKLYDLIWKRTIASQMEAARMERTTVTIASADQQVELRATGQVVLFDGFLKVYEEGRDDEADEDSRRLPQMARGEALKPVADALKGEWKKLSGDGATTRTGDLATSDAALLSADGATLGQQHFTQAPPRYTEATLVKRMEELGIGRPSTYASILDTIVARGYVRKDKNRLIPEDKGRLVTAFLVNYFRRYVEYDFTADLENQLDEVSAGDRAYKDVLTAFWRDFSASLSETSELRITDVLDKINEVLEPHLFPPRPDGSDPRACPSCGAGRLSMRTARSGGAFIGCSNYPECRYTRPFGPPNPDGDDGTAIGPDGKMLGVDPDTSEPVTLRDGRFGPYVQLGEATEDNPKPKRASLPKGWQADAMDIDKALKLLTLPRMVGPHPEDGAPVEAAIGRFGPYVSYKAQDAAKPLYANLPDVEEVWTIGMNRAVELLAAKAAGRSGRGSAAAPLKELGEHPEHGGPVQVMPGRYGPYVKWDKVNATIPKDIAPEAVTLEQAVELISEKAAKAPTKAKAKAKAKPKTAKAKTTKTKAPTKKS
jgi:DNA topoisomerase I